MNIRTRFFKMFLSPCRNTEMLFDLADLHVSEGDSSGDVYLRPITLPSIHGKRSSVLSNAISKNFREPQLRLPQPGNRGLPANIQLTRLRVERSTFSGKKLLRDRRSWLLLLCVSWERGFFLPFRFILIGETEWSCLFRWNTSVLCHKNQFRWRSKIKTERWEVYGCSRLDLSILMIIFSSYFEKFEKLCHSWTFVKMRDRAKELVTPNFAQNTLRGWAKVDGDPISHFRPRSWDTVLSDNKMSSPENFILDLEKTDRRRV